MHSEIFRYSGFDNSFEVLLSHSFSRVSTLPRKYFSIILAYIVLVYTTVFLDLTAYSTF